MSELKLAVITINRTRGLAAMSDGREMPVVRWIDCDGDDCDEEDAVAAVIGDAYLGYWVADLRDFEPLVRH